MRRFSIGVARRGSTWVVVGALTMVLSACDASSPALSALTPAQLFNHPPADPGDPWSFDGRQVGSLVAESSAGSDHCGWQSATFLTLGWPPGTYRESSEQARQFVRDPQGVTHSSLLLTSLELSATLPADAKFTGLSFRSLAIYVSPADSDRAVYVVGGGVTERWPRSEPWTLCL